MSSTQIEQARTRMLEVGRRARQDPGFNDQLKANPVETLRSAGLNDGEINDYIKEEGLDEVMGHAMSTRTKGSCACTNACCCTNCCNTQ